MDAFFQSNLYLIFPYRLHAFHLSSVNMMQITFRDSFGLNKSSVLWMLLFLFNLTWFSPSLFAQKQTPSKSFVEGYQLYNQRKFGAAIPKLEQALGEDARQENAYRMLVFCYLQVGNSIRAKDALARGLRQFPQNPRLLALRAELLLQDQQAEEAYPILQSLEQTLKSGAKIEGLTLKSVQSKLGAIAQIRGARAYQANRKDEALRHFRAAVQYLPDSLSVHNNLTVLLLEQEKWDEALTAANTGLRYFPQNVALLQMKSKVLLRQEKYGEMETVWKALYDKTPRDLDIALTYGQILLVNRKNAEAQTIFDKLLTLYPKEKKLYEALININEQGFNYQIVTTLLIKQRKQFPQDEEVMRKLAQAYEVTNEWKSARAAYDSLATMSGNRLWSEIAIARTYQKQDSLAIAIRHFEALRTQYPQNREVKWALGGLFRKEKRWTEARDTYFSLTTADSTDRATAWMRWSEAQQKLAQTSEALLGYQKAIEGGIQHPLPYLGLAQLLAVPDPKRCESGETALRKSLRGVKALQERQIAQVQERSISGIDERLSTKEQLEEMDALGGQAFEHFSSTCPRPDVERVISELLRTYQGSGKLYYYVGTFYRRMNEMPRAKTYFNEAATFAPQLTENQEALGQMYEAEGAMMQAILSYERILTVKPDYAPAYRKLIELYRQQGQLSQLADKWLARYRATPQNKVLREHLIEALHKSDRLDEAREVASPNKQ